MSQIFKRAGIVVVALGVVAAMAIEGSTRLRVETRYKKSLQAQRQLEHEVSQVRVDRDHVFDLLKAEQKRADQVSKELLAKDQELQHTVDRLMQEDLIVKDLQERVTMVQARYDDLQEELMVALRPSKGTTQTASSKAVRLEKVIVGPSGSTTTGRTTGRVVSVHPDWKFVVIDLGWKTVGIGDVVAIYREEQLLGKARIERVQEEVAAAELLPEWAGTEVKVNDVVRAL